MLGILSIDPGFSNFTYVKTLNRKDDNNPLEITEWRKEEVFKYKDSMESIYNKLDRWWEANKGFPDVEVIAVEKQIKGKLVSVTAWFKGRDHKRVRIVNPRSWRNFFGLGGGDYKTKKKISVEVCQDLIRDYFGKVRFSQDDDAAESLLLNVYVAREMGYSAFHPLLSV